MNRFDVLILNLITERSSVAEFGLSEQDANALVQNLNSGNLKADHIAYAHPTPNETAPQAGPDEAAASHPAA